MLNVTGNTVNRTYGDLLKNHDYALSINGFDGFNDAMKAELDGKVTIIDSQDTIQNSNDTGIITVGDEKRTKNKGTYEWQAGVKLDGSLTGNYEFINNGESSTTTTVHGVSKVLARKVYLNNINANLTYGSSDAINNHINGVVSIKDLANAIVYGDDVKLADGAVVNVKDGSSYATNKGGRNTADADTYADSLKIDHAALTGDANKLGNYELVNNATGSITVNQAEMHVKLNGVERTYGNTALINSTSYGVNGLTGNVNGDNYAAGDVTLGAVNRDGAVDGVSGSKVTNDAGDTYKWNANVVAANDKLQQNYKLVVDDGASVVKQATLQVSLNDVVRTYGNTSFTDGTGYGIKNHDALVNGDEGTLSIKEGAITDGGLVYNNSKTNNKGEYTWTVGENSIVAENVANFAKNYDIKVTAGNSKVNAKKIYLNNINASTTYGSKDGLRVDGNVSLQDNSIVYGDQVSLKDGASVSYKADGEYAANKGERDTADAGEYKKNVVVTGAELVGNELGNYELVNNATGSITVKQAEMQVKLNGVERTYGNTALINGTAYGVNGLTGNVNGDNYGVGNVTMGAVTDDGALTGTSTGKVTNDAGDTYKWNADVVAANDKLKQNYKLVVDGGASVVKQATLQVSLNDVVRTYGNAAITSGGYSAGNITGLVNGDSYDASAITVTN